MDQAKRKIYGVGLIGVALMCAVGFVLGRGFTKANNQIISSPPQTVPGNSLATEQQPRLSNMVALPIALRMNGFAPAEIERPAGDFFISVTNLTGFPDLEFQLDREKGEQLHSVKVPREKPTWRQSVRLTPGTYLLTVRDHSEWSCRITITFQ